MLYIMEGYSWYRARSIQQTSGGIQRQMSHMTDTHRIDEADTADTPTNEQINKLGWGYVENQELN